MSALVEANRGQGSLKVNFLFLVCGEAVVEQIYVLSFVIQIPSKRFLTNEHQLRSVGDILLFEGLLEHQRAHYSSGVHELHEVELGHVLRVFLCH